MEERVVVSGSSRTFNFSCRDRLLARKTELGMTTLACLTHGSSQLRDACRKFGLPRDYQQSVEGKDELTHIYSKKVTFLSSHCSTA